MIGLMIGTVHHAEIMEVPGLRLDEQKMYVKFRGCSEVEEMVVRSDNLFSLRMTNVIVC